MKTTKSPFKINKSLGIIIPDWIVKSKNITAKSRLTISQTAYGFMVKVR